MGWQNVDQKKRDAGQREAAQHKEQEEARALRRAARRAFQGEGQGPLRDELLRAVRRSTYNPNASHADMAYAEGYRKLAVDLLKLGGIYD